MAARDFDRRVTKPQARASATIAVKSIGSIASRKRRQIAEFEAARLRSMEKLNHQRAQLKKDVEEFEARERRRARKLQTAARHQPKLALGGLLLSALRAQGSDAAVITAQDLKRLQEKDRLRLAETLGVSQGREMNSDSAPEPGNPRDVESGSVGL